MVRAQDLLPLGSPRPVSGGMRSCEERGKEGHPWDVARASLSPVAFLASGRRSKPWRVCPSPNPRDLDWGERAGQSSVCGKARPRAPRAGPRRGGEGGCRGVVLATWKAAGAETGVLGQSLP